LLGADDPALGQAGHWFALGDVARHGLAPVLERPVGRLRFTRRLRPLTALARLAVRDLLHGEPFEPEATPGRAAALLRHRWSGIVAGD
jgi:phytoene synthase